MHNQLKHTLKFQHWYLGEKEKGLIDIKFSIRNISNSTTESFFR